MAPLPELTKNKYKSGSNQHLNKETWFNRKN